MCLRFRRISFRTRITFPTDAGIIYIFNEKKRQNMSYKFSFLAFDQINPFVLFPDVPKDGSENYDGLSMRNLA